MSWLTSTTYKEMTSIFTRALLVLLMLFTFTISSTPVNASQNHDVHAAAMSQDVIHEHIRDCAAACGIAERSESRKLNVNQRKKEKELEPEQDPYPINTRNYQYPTYKFRTVFLEQKNTSYLRFAQLRL
jgi:hypothetical protein